MKWIAKTKNGVLEFNSVKVCTESQFNKLGAGINRQRIIAWCDDNHISFEIQRGEQYMSIIREVVQEINESEARRIDILHDKFLEFVDSLPEVDATETCKSDEHLEENIKFVKKVLNEWDETETRLGTCGAILLGEDSKYNITISCGCISGQLLKQMFEAWLDKYGK